MYKYDYKNLKDFIISDDVLDVKYIMKECKKCHYDNYKLETKCPICGSNLITIYISKIE